MPASDFGLSPLGQLGRRRNGEPAFLDAHHLKAAGRLQTLFERSRLRGRTTMNYGPRVDSGHGGHARDMSDMALDARRQLTELYMSLPRDCVDVVIDVCGYEKGMQDIERERGWPRRSAKLVLRIGLDALATRFGLSASATGDETAKMRSWLGNGATPTEFG
ncbi:DUF6456 domain-containing protein [Pelagibacterium halotolerans]|uniref:DUF6456 domain-containing protein n=1 Tax=Pelagibacterium halotolerans (strain DSM 22347 / JCM 15775 / CGMCC 1.7692 / B2) TaxID=1082931 RepID=G4RCJ5_PELHB|nr:DUF6456 domain-containing protein [Pelagibacterium halotolerans]AEQ50667.1 hypothetical protein KKY_628 [Pelagibacterium halotolerans B2]QJR19399.1 DNA replication protein [Pelagibacterium halotolerans]SDZ92513.1 hypothetical protein SAMN05428936_101557 [Pelagibacterium halotolerans]